jgi:hypothetical protein
MGHFQAWPEAKFAKGWSGWSRENRFLCPCWNVREWNDLSVLNICVWFQLATFGVFNVSCWACFSLGAQWVLKNWGPKSTHWDPAAGYLRSQKPRHFAGEAWQFLFLFFLRWWYSSGHEIVRELRELLFTKKQWEHPQPWMETIFLICCGLSKIDHEEKHLVISNK